MPQRRIPVAEYPIDEALVRSLLRKQFPEFANAPIRAMDEGWDNALFRLGDEVVSRLPRRAAAAPLLEKEREFLPEITSIASALAVRVPVHLRHGVPGCGYPWHWTIAPWLPGVPADEGSFQIEEGERLGSFLRTLHGLVPRSVPPRNPFRGVPLKERAVDMAERIQRLSQTGLVTNNILQIWREALEAPTAAGSVLIHGDLHARNVLVENGRITGIIDWGDLTCGDAATDLAAWWTVLDSQKARHHATNAYSWQPTAMWARARGWAVRIALVLLDSGGPRGERMGRKILRQLDESHLPSKPR